MQTKKYKANIKTTVQTKTHNANKKYKAQPGLTSREELGTS